MKFFSQLFLALLLFSSIAYSAERLIIEPDDGREPLLSLIDDSKSSIDMVMYGFTDARFMNALVHAKRNGKEVRVLLEPHPYRAETENEFAIKRLKSADVTLQWPSKNYKLTHQKTILLDQQKAIVMTFNLTNSSFKNERNFALVIDDPAEVNEIKQVFNNDWQHKNSNVRNSQLVWSPNNSREKILDLINHTHSDLKMYAQGLSDYHVIGALAKIARQGKRVDIVLSGNDNDQNRKFNFLRKAGVVLHFNKNLMIHAKVLIIDKQLALIGSINFTRPSMNDNRELSIITKSPDVIAALLKTFQRDSQGFFTDIQPSPALIKTLKKITRELIASLY